MFFTCLLNVTRKTAIKALFVFVEVNIELCNHYEIQLENSRFFCEFFFVNEKFLSASISNRNFSDCLPILTTFVKNVLALLQSNLINTAY
jgi:hypothetical protein